MKKTTKPSKIKALVSKIAVGAAIVVLAGATIVSVVKYNASQDNATQLSENLAKVNANLDALNLTYSSTLINNSNLKTELNAAVAASNLNLEKFNNATIAKDAVIADYAELKKEYDALQVAGSEVFSGFIKDDLSLNYNSAFSVDHNDLEKLGDYEISFDGDTVDVAETIGLSGAFASNDRHFDGTTMYKLSSGDLLYKVSFDTNMSDLDYNEDSVKFNFLGEPMKVINWTSDSVTLEADNEYTLAKGESKDNVTLERIGEQSVLVSYDGVTKPINKGDTYDFGPIKVKVESIFFEQGATDNVAVLKIGEDLKKVIVDGDEYNDNYDYFVTEDSIGLKLVEDFDEYDTALVEGKTFSLPNDYATLSFDLSKEDMNKINVEYRAADEVRFKGDFDKAKGTVTFNGTKFIDANDKVFDSIALKNSDYNISYNGTDFVVGDIIFSKDVDSLSVNSENYTDSDVNVKSNIGIEISAPKDDLEDQILEFSVPKEAIKAEIKVE